MEGIVELVQFLKEMDKLKSVYRQSILVDQSRRENSAEHSWQMAVAILAMKDRFDPDIDFFKTIKMALLHDVCEIGAGDISVYSPDRDSKPALEEAYLDQLISSSLPLTQEIRDLWQEYEDQVSAESRWVKVADRLLPFMLNIASDGKTWLEHKVTKSQWLKVHEPVKHQAPDIYAWMLTYADDAIKNGWLIDE